MGVGLLFAFGFEFEGGAAAGEGFAEAATGAVAPVGIVFPVLFVHGSPGMHRSVAAATKGAAVSADTSGHRGYVLNSANDAGFSGVQIL